MLGELDDFMVTYKNDRNLSKSQFDYLIAAIEFRYPKVKGSLQWSKQVATGMAMSNNTHHTVPLISAPARLFGTHIAQKRPRLGFAVPLHQALGLRPSELLKLRRSHVLVPPRGVGRFVFRLGAKIGTKVKREQVAYLDSRKHTQLAFILLMLLNSCADNDELLFPYSYWCYNRALAAVEQELGLDLGITPHSCRAGFASEAVALGEQSVQSVKDAGRWLSDSSFRTYVDVVAAAQVQAMVALTGQRKAMEFVATHFIEYFSVAAFVSEVHGASGVREAPIDGDLSAQGDGLLWQPYEAAHSGPGIQVQGHGPAEPRQQEVSGSGAAGKASGKGRAKGAGQSKLISPKGFRPRRLPQADAQLH